MTMLVNGFWHGGVSVSDMEAALGFYEGLLGLEKVSDRVTGQGSLLRIGGTAAKEIRVCLLRIPGSEVYLELLEYRPAGELTVGPPLEVSVPGTGHLCLYVEDVRALWGHLTTHGVVSISPGPVDCSERIPGTWCVYVRDPDGYAVELFEGPRYPDRTPLPAREGNTG